MTKSPKKLRIVFFGTPSVAQICLEKLIDSSLKPQLVVAAPDKKAGRGRKLQMSPVKRTAFDNKIDVLQPKNLQDKKFQFSIFNFQFDLAILVAYGKIIPKEILSIPKYGFVNIHPSLLPKYRGPSPIQSAILAGDAKTGITVIKLDEKMDHGPIMARKEIKIKNNDTHVTLVEKLGKLGAELLLETLPEYILGKIKLKAQNHQKATITCKITKEDGLINLQNPPNPQTLNRMIRAFYPWPGTWCQLPVHGQQFTVKFLPGNFIQPEGKRSLAITEFKNGYPIVYEQIMYLFSQKVSS